jgi:hypothetical protein
VRWLLGLAIAVAVAACSQDLSTIGGGQILEFRNDLHRPVTFLYCPQQGCARPVSRRVPAGEAWRTANETINGSGAVSIRIGSRLTGCRLVPAVGVLVDPLATYKATFVRGGPGCVG